MHEQVAVLQHITHHLEQAGILYMLSGSTAMNYYAQPRMTRDIDLVVEIQVADTARLVVQLGEDYGPPTGLALSTPLGGAVGPFAPA